MADDPDQDLSTLGLSPAEEAVYEYLVDREVADLAEIVTGVVHEGPLPAVLEGLVEIGLVSCLGGHPPRYQAMPPELVLEDRLVAAEREVDEARGAAQDLVSRHRAHLAEPGRDTVEVVIGRRALQQRVVQARRSTRHELRCLDRLPYVDRATTTDIQLELLRRDIGCRTLYDQVALDQPGALADLERFSGAGGQARLAPRVPTTLCLVDDRVGLLPLQRGASEVEAALVIHPSGLLDALGNLFEGLWQQGLVLCPSDDQPDQERRARVDRDRLVTLLLTGMTDEAVAHQLGTGPRTVQRRVAALMADLGASTRFQAGVQAAKLRRSAPPRG